MSHQATVAKLMGRARGVRCPKCGAPAGVHCKGVKSQHAARIAVIAPPSKSSKVVTRMMTADERDAL